MIFWGQSSLRDYIDFVVITFYDIVIMNCNQLHVITVTMISMIGDWLQLQK